MEPLFSQPMIGGGRSIIPVAALLLMVMEYGYGRVRGASVYDGRETLATIVISTGNRVLNAALGAAAFVPLGWLYEHRLFTIPTQSIVWGVVLFVAVEFCYYWHHVAMHRMRWFWATHLVHHSAQHFNLSAAVRLGWGGTLLGGAVFYMPLAWIGFPPRAIAAMLALGLAYQFLLHLASAPTFGPLEWIFNTPTHHRIHHASNVSCLDKNFGAVLIVFDRLFGTFAAAPKDEKLTFGLKDSAVTSYNPLSILTCGWRAIFAGLRNAESWRARTTAVFGPP